MLPEAKAEHISCCPCTLHDSAEGALCDYMTCDYNLSLVTIATCCFRAAHGAFELQHPPFSAKSLRLHVVQQRLWFEAQQMPVL